MKKQVIIAALFLGLFSAISAQTPGCRIISTHGYENCIEISNAVCRVVLEPNMGGRVLVYEIDGKNAMYIDPAQNGLKFTNKELETAPGIQPCAGRFDIGPERLKPNTKLFWQGQWSAEITGKFAARMTSQIDTITGIQLIRDFSLDTKSSKLKITQTIKNLGAKPQKLCFWSRTFASGGGICIVPLSSPNRFPKGYIEYTDGNAMRFVPESDKNIVVVDSFLFIKGPTKLAKFIFDSNKGWMGYITTDDMLFVKTYDYKSTGEYGEMAAVPLSIWYKDDKMAELEPIGPWEWIQPNGETSYAEVWHLLPYKYPENKEIDVTGINAKVKALD